MTDTTEATESNSSKTKEETEETVPLLLDDKTYARLIQALLDQGLPADGGLILEHPSLNHPVELDPTIAKNARW